MTLIALVSSGPSADDLTNITSLRTRLTTRTVRWIGLVKTIGAANISRLRQLSSVHNTDPAAKDKLTLACPKSDQQSQRLVRPCIILGSSWELTAMACEWTAEVKYCIQESSNENGQRLQGNSRTT